MNFRTEIYQLNGEAVSFRYLLNGEANENELTAKNIAKFFSAKLFKVWTAQAKIKKATGKSRFLRLARTKPLYFSFTSETLAFDTELEQTLAFKFIIGEMTEKEFRTALELVLDIVLSENNL